MTKNHVMTMLVLISLLILSQRVFAEITLSHTQISDVTPSSFSVIWHASEVSVPRIEVYSDAEGTQAITHQSDIIHFPQQGSSASQSSVYLQTQSRLALQQAAQQKGLNKLQVSGLSPETSYYFKVISDSETDSGIWPAIGTQSVTTQKENAFLKDNAVLVINLNDPESQAWIVTASIAASTYPVSRFVESGAESGQAVINLSNLFGNDGVNWSSDLSTSIIIQVLKGNGDILTESLNVDLSSTFAVASHVPFEFSSPLDALIQIVLPAQKVYSRGEPVKVAWTDNAVNINATISLYMDVDNTGADGVLIASGIEEALDGNDDEYHWDVSHVTEGSYYVYAVMDDGGSNVTTYGHAKITVDHNQSDSDNDQLSDLWEEHFFGALSRDGTGDSDSDGLSDELEHFYNVDPEQSNASLQVLNLGLKKGANIIGVPGILIPQVSSYNLLTQLGNTIYSISHYNQMTQQRETSYWVDGSPAGDEFYLLPGEGYFVQMLEDSSLVWSPYDSNKAIPLKEGVNVIAIAKPTGNSFELLDSLGSDVIWSIRRQEPVTSLYETSAFDGIEKVGTAFPMQYGEGYIVTVKQDTQINSNE